MIKIAIYGKGGIGKSTTVSNIAAALADQGLRVMQIGCDPKADSTVSLHAPDERPTVLELVRTKKDAFELKDMITIGYKGIVCVEAGGPTPGLGCAGRGIIAALEKLRAKGAYETYKPDVVFYDVLGDVVCGGFSMPMRRGYADKVFIITSGENMALHAAANIAMKTLSLPLRRCQTANPRFLPLYKQLYSGFWYALALNPYGTTTTDILRYLRYHLNGDTRLSVCVVNNLRGDRVLCKLLERLYQVG